VYQGNGSASLVRVGELFRDAVRVNAAGLILVHNHRIALKRLHISGRHVRLPEGPQSHRDPAGVAPRRPPRRRLPQAAGT